MICQKVNPSHLWQNLALGRCYNRNYGFFLTKRDYNPREELFVACSVTPLLLSPTHFILCSIQQSSKREPIISSLNYARQMSWLTHSETDAEPSAVQWRRAEQHITKRMKKQAEMGPLRYKQCWQVGSAVLYHPEARAVTECRGISSLANGSL